MRAQTSYHFRRVSQREDTSSIKKNCTDDHIHRESGDNWRTLYNDSYIRHPIAVREKANAPNEGIYIGGGNLSPTKEEMTSNYAQNFKKFGRQDVPARADPLPCSDIIQYDKNSRPPLSTTHAAMKEANDNRPPYDNSEAKERKEEGVSSHLYFGGDLCYDTTYKNDFKNRNFDRPPSIDNGLQKSHIQFDSNAGYGPNQRHRSKKEPCPSCPDVPKPNHLKINFDVGYSTLDYRTSTQDALPGFKQNYRPAAYKAPECASLADHGNAAPKWETTYNSDFNSKTPIPNNIDLFDLKKAHWTNGFDKVDYSRPRSAIADHVPQLESTNFQKSNPVFSGDGEMVFRTTASDMLGNYDLKAARANKNYMDVREDHLFLGGDSLNYETTSKASNRFAGQGRPATQTTNLHHLKGNGFARGGIWDPIAGPDGTSEKSPRGHPEVEKVDPKFYTQSHFALDATSKGNKFRCKTTYFEEICRPTLVEEKKKK